MGEEIAKKPNIWLTSDTHFFHFNIIRYCARPFEDEGAMNLEMERRWLLLVEPDDILIHVGDLTAGLKGRKEELKALIGRLPGKKVLVKGNHDHMTDQFYLDAGFKKVVDYFHVSGLLFAHVPDTGESETSHPHPWADITRKLRERFKPVLTIHGHVHRTDIPEYDGHFNCAADRHNYMPFTLASALERCGLSGRVEQAREDIYAWLEKEKVADNETNASAV